MSSTSSENNVALVPLLRGIFKTMRPHQWTKNLLIFAPIFFDQKLFQWGDLLRVFLGFLLLCLTASVVYLVNDIVDVESDRKHPKKRYRPIASGAVPIPAAWGATAILLLIALPGSFAISPLLTGTLILYLALHFAYSFRLKHIVLIDVLSITAGFVLRILAGVSIITVENFSPWLYVVTLSLSLFLAVGKRRQEYIELGEKAVEVRPVFGEYNIRLLDELLRLALFTTFLTYLLYTIETTFPGEYLIPKPGLLTVPFVTYGLMRYLYLVYVREDGSAPDEVLMQDRPLQAAIVLWVLSFLAILYVPALI
jgi:4-hydroxybenzoate polyprenyltransferase